MNKKKTENGRLLINMISNIVSYSTGVLMTFVLTPYLINNIGKEAYSFYPLANSLILYMSVVTNALNAMASRYITIAIAREDNAEANEYFSSTIIANLCISLLLLVPMTFIVLFIDVFLDIPINLIASVRVLFAFTFTNLLLNIITAVFGVATFATNRIDLRSLRELVLNLLKIFLYIVFFGLFNPDISYVGIVTFIVSLLGFIIQYGYTKKLLPNIRISINAFNISTVKTIIYSSSWNIINSLGSMLLAGSSLILANIFYGTTLAAEYAIVQTVPNFVNGLISMLTGVFYPVIMKTYAVESVEKLVLEVKKAQTFIGLFSTSVVGVFIVMSSSFFSLWTPLENIEWLNILSSITIIPHCIIGCMWILSYLSITLNKVKIPALYLSLSGLLNIVLAFLMYKYTNLGIISIPIISTAIQVIWVFIFFPIYSSLVLRVSIKTFYPAIIRGIVSFFSALFITTVGISFVEINSWISFFFVGGTIGLLVLFTNLFIMVDIDTIKKNMTKILILFEKSKK
ncbi:oligosaccharide flippase family protein [Tannockella kyphosi]|uniref:oligosaccharide flippase family protein n=1 Tax=Tannockella kyphosi TaxID=2899121 RepID=UPI002013A56E|nr:oligosaccharide flippase family protein [Tannockella kyphosi]